MPITHINPQQLVELLENTPELQLIDVRTPEEYVGLGHITQAQLIPLHELPYAFRMLNVEQPVAITCEHGVRSLDASYFLQAQGFETIYNLQEGMSSWQGPRSFEAASPVDNETQSN